MKLYGADAEIILDDGVSILIAVEFKAETFDEASVMAKELIRDVINTEYEPFVFRIEERVDEEDEE